MESIPGCFGMYGHPTFGYCHECGCYSKEYFCADCKDANECKAMSARRAIKYKITTHPYVRRHKTNVTITVHLFHSWLKGSEPDQLINLFAKFDKPDVGNCQILDFDPTFDRAVVFRLPKEMSDSFITELKKLLLTFQRSEQEEMDDYHEAESANVFFRKKYGLGEYEESENDETDE
jgi:hypothetical protein